MPLSLNGSFSVTEIDAISVHFNKCTFEPNLFWDDEQFSLKWKCENLKKYSKLFVCLFLICAELFAVGHKEELNL